MFIGQRVEEERDEEGEEGRRTGPSRGRRYTRYMITSAHGLFLLLQLVPTRGSIRKSVSRIADQLNE